MAIGPPTDRMPPLGLPTINTQFGDLFAKWIVEDAPKAKSFEQWQTASFPSNITQGVEPDDDFDRDVLTNYGEYLLGTNPDDPNSRWRPSLTLDATQGVLSFKTVANRAIIVEEAPNAVRGPWLPLLYPANRFTFPSEGGATKTFVFPRGEQKFFRFNVTAP